MPVTYGRLLIVGAALLVMLVIGCSDAQTPPPDDSLIWQYETGGSDERVVVSPTVVEGVVYAGSNEDRVYGMDADTGDILWSFEAGRDLHSPPLVSGAS